MIEILCWIKKYWLRTYLLVASIIGIILQISGASKKIISIFQLGYLIIHTLVVKYLYNTECKKFKKIDYDEVFDKYKDKLDSTINQYQY